MSTGSAAVPLLKAAPTPDQLAERLEGGDWRGLEIALMEQRAALHPREDRLVERGRVLLLAEDEAAARAGERLVRRRGDEVAVRHRVRMQTRGDEPGEVRHARNFHYAAFEEDRG